MFQLDQSDGESDDEIFSLEFVDKGILSYGVENNSSKKIKLNRDVNELLSLRNTMDISTDSIPLTPSYSPITSTQIDSNIQIDNVLFDRTNVISPIKMRPGISSAVKCTERSKTYRKFPGPAGNLPELGKDGDLDSIVVSSITKLLNKQKTVNEKEKLNSSFLTPTTQSGSKCVAWKVAERRIGQHAWSIFQKYTLKNVIELLQHSKNLPKFKIPLICLQLSEINLPTNDASSLMSDGTGSIKCAIHRPVLQKYKERIRMGSVFILKNVSIFTPSRRKYYLNITGSNIIDIVDESGDWWSSASIPLLKKSETDQILSDCLTKLEVDFNIDNLKFEEDSVKDSVTENRSVPRPTLHPQKATVSTANLHKPSTLFDDDMEHFMSSLGDEDFNI